MDGIVRAHFEHPVERVFGLVTDPAYLRRRAEAARERNVMVSADRDGTRLSIRIERDLERDMPGFMKRIFNPVNHMVDVQTWETAGEVKTSDWKVEIVGQKRIDLRGRLSLAPASDGGCDYSEAFTVAVAIPLVGGRVEKYVAGETEGSMREQIAFLRAELARTGG
ncbi:MAG TPA: DUF2505 family protein [Kofleriaceae bacterium]|nr:DUF2505 family protein [Kofleriaceae bacterium]